MELSRLLQTTQNINMNPHPSHALGLLGPSLNMISSDDFLFDPSQ